MSAALLVQPPRSASSGQAPVQLDWAHIFFHTLLEVEEAAELLDDAHKRFVVALCEEGRLRGVNIACGAERRTIRVWRYSVHWMMESARRQVKTPPAPATLEPLLPHGRRNFWIKEVADFLRCDERHVRNLALGGPEFSERKNRVSREALIGFLQQREIGV